MRMHANFWSENHLGDLSVDEERRVIAIKIYLKETECEDVAWIHLAQDSAQQWARLGTVMNLQIP
jgi:hypothetical protein